MNRLMRTSEITKRPVVTLGGEDVAQIRDVVYSPDGGAVGGFTLAGRGLLAGPMRKELPWANVLAVGADAVMIRGDDALDTGQGVTAASASVDGGGGDVLGAQVLTDGGTDLGTVIDVILDVPTTGGGECDVVGYEIQASEALGTKGTKLLIPLPQTLSASGQHLMVPASAQQFVSQDLAGFGASVEAFRAQLGGE